MNNAGAVRRNQIVAGLFHRIGFVENMGTGITNERWLAQLRHLDVGLWAWASGAPAFGE